MPYRLLFPAIVLFCVTGVYVINLSVEEVYMMAAFGLVGLALHRFGCDPVPLLLGFILGPMMEENLRRALLLSARRHERLLHPSAVAGVPRRLRVLVVISLLPALTRKREQVFSDDD